MLNQSLYIIYHYICVLGFWPCPQIGNLQPDAADRDSEAPPTRGDQLCREGSAVHVEAAVRFTGDTSSSNERRKNVKREIRKSNMQKNVGFGWFGFRESSSLKSCCSKHGHGSIWAPHPWRPGLPRHAPGWASSSGCQQCGCRRQLLRSLADGCWLMWADVGCWAASCMFQFPSGNTRPNNSAWIPVWKCDRFNMLQPGLFELPFAALKPLMKSQPSRHLLQTLVMHGGHQLLRMSTRRMASCWLPRDMVISSYVAICRLWPYCLWYPLAGYLYILYTSVYHVLVSHSASFISWATEHTLMICLQHVARFKHDARAVHFKPSCACNGTRTCPASRPCHVTMSFLIATSSTTKLGPFFLPQEKSQGINCWMKPSGNHMNSWTPIEPRRTWQNSPFGFWIATWSAGSCPWGGVRVLLAVALGVMTWPSGDFI